MTDVSLGVWALFVVTESILCLTPGPAVLLVVAQALGRGAAASVWATLGILTGNALYFVLSATGLGALLLASYELFSLVRWLGAAYLIWLGVRAFSGRSATRSTAPTVAMGRRRTFVNGFVLQAANPKALLFFVALLPQFHRARRPGGRPGPRAGGDQRGDRARDPARLRRGRGTIPRAHRESSVRASRRRSGRDDARDRRRRPRRRSPELIGTLPSPRRPR
jgi:homoserine/homoserine lactone efflux protein